MVKLIIGLKGSGKTKALVGLVCKAVDEDTGDVICIEKDRKLTYDIPYKARLIDAGSYDIGSGKCEGISILKLYFAILKGLDTILRALCVKHDCDWHMKLLSYLLY